MKIDITLNIKSQIRFKINNILTSESKLLQGINSNFLFISILLMNRNVLTFLIQSTGHLLNFKALLIFKVYFNGKD